MEELEKWKRWLGGYPGWTGELTLDDTGTDLGSGLFPQGTTVLHRQADVVGNRYVRNRCTCRLRRISPGTEAAAWMAAFAGWVQEQSEKGNVPGLGDVPGTETVSAVNGRLEKRDMGGTATYVIDLVCEYTRVYPAG